MKKVAVLLLVVFLLSACTPGASPTLTDAEMATRVASILTSMPTTTVMVTLAPTAQVVLETPIPTQQPPAVADTKAAPTASPSPEPSATPVPEDTLVPTITLTPSETPLPSATPPETDPRTKLGKADDTDSMDNPDHWVWPSGKDLFTSNGFKDGKMWMTGLTDKPGWVVAAVETTDMYLEMKMTTETCSGSDNYGIIFRVPVLREADRGYLFGLSCDGKYALWKWDGKISPKGQRTLIRDWKANDAINKGSNQTNRLGIKTVGSKLSLYVNGYLLEEFKDTSYKSGYFGVFINPDATSKFTINVEQASLWKNPE